MRRLMLAVFAVVMLLTGCEKQEEMVVVEPTILQDLAYVEDSQSDHRVFLSEGDVLVPYLVLRAEERGACLLLREHLMDENQVYSNGGTKAGYYGSSEIDGYLNEVFAARLSDYVQKQLVDSDIVITARESLGNGGDVTETIQRKVFLLSYTEMNCGSSRSNLEEGVPLAYFADQESRVAFYENGTPGSWWLRTANTSGRTVVCAVSEEGVPAMCPIYDATESGGHLNGVRPALYLPSDLQLLEADVNGQQVYVIENLTA